ncbi:MAG: ABC transporter ATP-binding protein [Negativicutes bacterium]
MNTKATPLQAEGVSVQLGGRTILQDCSFAVKQGEFVGIIGPNGAGKSTLMRSLRGLLPLTTGQVNVFGFPIHAMADKQAARLVAYMQQDVNAGFGYTALEVVLAGRYPYLDWWRNETNVDRAIARRYMKFTGVEELSDKPVNQVSGGERQRILLAKVLAQETPLIFLDEPTASLDLVYQEEIFRHCQAVCTQGKSVLLIAHDIKLAAKFCSRLLLVADGKILADGAPEEVVTPGNLDQAYGLHSAVFLNQVTGNLDLHTFARCEHQPEIKRVHVIGGGGSIGGILRRLFERGYQVTAGVLQAGDTDADVATAFGIDYVRGKAFTEIDDAQAQSHRQLIAAADWVILGSIYYGRQNLDNLKAAFFARCLIMVEDLPIKNRDCVGGEATTLYRELQRKKQVRLLDKETLLQELGDGRLFRCGADKVIGSKRRILDRSSQ